MKKRLLLGAAALALLSALGHFGAKPLLAQIRAAWVKNIDEPGRSPYQSSSLGTSKYTTCDVAFSPVPAGKRLVVESLSVLADIPVATNVGLGQFITANDSDGILRFVASLSYFNFSSAGSTVWISNPKVTAYIESGLRPVATLAVDGGKSCYLQGVLSGYLIDLNQ